MSTIDSLAQAFMKFPGIGTRQAKRFVYFLLAQDPQFIEKFSEEIAELKKGISQCPECFRYYQHVGAENLCSVCSSDADQTLLLVIEKDVDFDSIRRSGGYKGRYFVIGGALPVLEKDPSSKIRIRELIARAEKSVRDGLSEVILAFSANPDGDTTRDYVAKMLEPITKKYGIKITALGRGLSTGTELEYSDSDTLRNAFKNRQ
jgi:recombination protein RecR